MKKNILLYLSTEPEDGGKFQYSISLVEELKKSLIDKNILAIYKGDVWKDYLVKFEVQGIKLELNENYLYYLIRKIIYEKLNLVSIWRLLNSILSKRYRVLKKYNPDLVYYPGNDSLAYEFNFPSVIPIFDLMHRYEKFPEVAESKIFKQRERHYKNVCKYAVKILVDSELGKKHVLECYSVDEKKIVIYPYKPPYYVYNYKEVNVKKKYNLPEKYFFYPAQFWEHKNHKIIVEAVKLLKEKGKNICFVFVGSPKNAYNNIIDLIRKYNLEDNFFILGYVNNDELVSLYKNSISLVFPSFFGPTNIPPLEAVALNVPVIISDVYANREQLGDRVIYFNPNNPVALSNILEELFDISDDCSLTEVG